MIIPNSLSDETSLRQTSCEPSKAITSVVVTI
uniref:Uncharacterized protein n=1 Tax=Lepeophtheirus salmonis TaxID=72036 RepID=A0A0K2TLS9_LEPSM